MHPNDGRVISNFIIQALTSKSITIYGDGRQTRSFCYVDDLIEGLIRLMNTPDEFTGPLNLGNPEEYTIVEIAELIRDLTGSKSEVRHLESVPDDPRNRKPEISMARQTLDWRPTISLREGLQRTIAYFDDLLRTETSS
jgi:UDP-glucuronate decarboxylase